MFTLDQQHADATVTLATRPHGGGEVVAPDPIRDPLLLAIDDVVLSVLGKLRLTRQVRNIASRIRLRDGKTDALVARQDAGQDAIDERFLAEFHNGRTADAEAADEVPHQAATAGSGDFVGEEQFVEHVPFLGWDALDGCLGEMGWELVQTHQSG